MPGMSMTGNYLLVQSALHRIPSAITFVMSCVLMTRGV